MRSTRSSDAMFKSAALPAFTRGARALDYPARPVHIIVAWAAGINPDIIARLFAQALSERLGQRFIVDNRPGAGGSGGDAAPKNPYCSSSSARTVFPVVKLTKCI